MTSPKEPSRRSHTPTHVALLRGINVGGKHKLPMSDLTAMFVNAGCKDVETYVQSGNVAFSASAATANRIPRVIANQILERFGFQPVVMVRTGKEIAAVAEGNPFVGPGVDVTKLLVGFLNEAPDAQLVAKLDPKRSPGDRFAVRGKEIYLHVPNGILETKFTNAYIDSTLATTSTFRNWRTVMKLLEMMREPA